MTRFSVPDMSCGHCKASIEAALTPLVGAVDVDLVARELRIEGGAPEQILQALETIGFPAQLLE